MSQPFEVEAIVGDGLKLSVLRRAPPAAAVNRRLALFLHGWPGTRGDWAPVTSRLAADSRFAEIDLVVPDLRGYGASDHPAVDLSSPEPHAGYGPAAHIADLIRLIEHYEADEVIVAGFDIGANLAQTLARKRSEIRGLVLCDPVHPAARAKAATVNLTAELWYQQLHVQPWAPQLIAHDRDTVEIYLRHFYTHWWGRGAVDEEHFSSLVESYARPGAFAASIGWYRARASARSTEVSEAAAAEALTSPAQILWGEADPVTPVLLAEGLSDSFTDFELERLAGVGHFVPLEAPNAVVAGCERLAAQLDWHAGRSP